MELTQEEIQANIEKLRNRVGDPRTGGKGSQRRKVKVVSKTNVPIPYNSGWRRQSRQEHRQESGSAPSWRWWDQLLPRWQHHPPLQKSRRYSILYSAYASIQNNTFIVTGEPETKTIKDLLPDIIQQLGPKQHKLLQELVSNLPETTTEEVPQLVESTPKTLDSVEWSRYYLRNSSKMLSQTSSASSVINLLNSNQVHRYIWNAALSAYTIIKIIMSSPSKLFSCV